MGKNSNKELHQFKIQLAKRRCKNILNLMLAHAWKWLLHGYL